jgi:putative peptidoglycan lipid II flippase
MTTAKLAAGPNTLARAAVLTVVITISGSVLGLVRDLSVARFFGANGATDAFVVAWTVPETAFPLVVEGTMSFLMVPLFSRAIAATGGSVREVVAATMPRIVAVLAVLAGLVGVGAPWLVHLLAPGLADPALAVTCMRWTSITVLTFGLAGYLSAALRAHHVFAAPAGIHLAYNIGILALIWSLHGRLGVLSAAIGVALGSLFMVLVQLPGYLRHVGIPRRVLVRGSLLTVGALAPIAVYTLTRQAQVFVERFLGSSLDAGTISRLNYAQKVAQLPMLVALLVCTVTFPTLARTVAAGDTVAARRRLESDLRAVTALVLLGAAYLVAFAPQIVELLFQHGRFTAADTAATAAILRVYSLGLLGHALVGVLSRPYFTGERPTWYPAVAMAAGLGTTAVLAAVGVPVFGVMAIVAANAIGITVTAVALLVGLGTRTVAVPVRAVAAATARIGAVAAAAGAAGWLVSRAAAGLGPVAVGAVGGVVVLVVFVVLARLSGVDGFGRLLAGLCLPAGTSAKVLRRVHNGQ